ncbi:hypothetical protein DCS32_12745 [Dokdonia sp. Dokd-P16]|uniref:formimidoylglutamase n=1 Tax=Dokdonia sp. Dokd-P16 TaxID=2173169 RepID=UPI000D5435C6|nr:formimidoylglutamase [Dokdonia sp. Dokd-P16]AWH74998.1 hypothetical protein DCS32_12745 [Dokdonia sp. Dokd-P16]
MIQLHIATRDLIRTCTSVREGETKLGETVQICDSLDDMATTSGTFVVFGICEDIGVQANYGKPGARKAWDSFLTTFVNIQENKFNKGADIILLGHISVSPDIKDIAQEPADSLGTIVNRIDSKVAAVVQRIIESGKIPIIIGGGHNNAYGIIKGTASALKKPIDIINFDAHTDLRSTDYRHSGNGFSYAFKQEKNAYLNHYTVFGLHENYTPQYILDAIEGGSYKDSVSLFLMEDMLLEAAQVSQFTKVKSTLSKKSLGIEVDCDSIAHFSSSAQSSTGFSLEMMRYYLTELAQLPLPAYLHICEASPSKKNKSQIGKALTYLVTDFIRNYREHHSI